MASYQRHRINSCRWTALRFRPHTHAHKLTQQRENKSVPGDVFQQLSEWLTVSPSKLHTQQMALSVSIGAAAQKDNSSVCAWGDYSIPLLFFPPRSIHTQIRGYWHSGTVKSHKHAGSKKHNTDTHREHGKVSDCLQERKEELQLFGEKKNVSWVRLKRSKNILSLNPH